MNNEIVLSDIDAANMVDAYQAALLWSSLVHTSDGDAAEHADEYETSASIRAHSIDAVNRFLAACAALDTASRCYVSENPEQSGHYLALSRNGHGAGFFDDGEDELQAVAERLGETHCFLDDNNEIDVECWG